MEIEVMTKDLNIRLLATKAILDIFRGNLSDVILDSYITKYKLDKQKSSYLSYIIYTLLENKITIDYQIELYTKEKFKKLDKEILNILRLGIVGIAYMDTPNSAAVNESVKLCQSFKKTSAKSFVNAVLRKVCLNGLVYPLEKETVENRLSIKYSVSEDIIKILKDYDNVEEILKTFKKNMLTSIRVNTLKIDDKKLLEILVEKGYNVSENSFLKNNLFLEVQGDIRRCSEFQKGYFYIQDTASQLAMSLVGFKESDIIIDLCSAPGGKSFMASFLTNGKGNIYSVDKNEDKINKIKETSERLSINNIKTFIFDSQKENEDLPMADIVICDVPCSGLGVISKKPEIRYKTLQEIDSIYSIQENILLEGSKKVKAGGKLVYSTCTLNKKENDDIIEKFLNNNKNFKPFYFNINYKNKNEENYKFTMMPNEINTDGFFVCMLVKY
ncbi:MAG: 16S rRNA (cytosine(967)-C(5))-methyltransferase RsmB [Oscillospiraceae bacterium]